MSKPHVLQSCAVVVLVGIACWVAVVCLGFALFTEWQP
jgi:hypothetical protein